MKLFLISCSFLILLLISFKEGNNSYFKRENAPPGTVKINDTLFIDQTEIGNIAWREFLFWCEQKQDSISYQQNLPDTTVCNKLDSRKMIFYPQVYFRHPMYNYFPVVGVSYEQSIEFCKWRSDRVNELYTLFPKKNPISGAKYRYRLPTEKEWELVAANLYDTEIYPYGQLSTQVLAKMKLLKYFNCIYKDSIFQNINDSLPTINDSYIKNSFGCYNMIGNVSEMVAEKGIAKGGNFLLPLDSCKIKLQQHYIKPECWLGFRCVCEIVK